MKTQRCKLSDAQAQKHPHPPVTRSSAACPCDEKPQPFSRIASNPENAIDKQSKPFLELRKENASCLSEN